MKTMSTMDYPSSAQGASNEPNGTGSASGKESVGGAAAPFVDLYELLEVSPASDVETLRRRIAQVYGEAQQNADHRNFRKRFYYQELLEVYLPQARHLLLNPQRRAEYDEQLGAFHDGKYEGHTLEFRYDPGDDLSNIPAQDIPVQEVEVAPEPPKPQPSTQKSAPSAQSANGVAARPTNTSNAPADALDALARRPVAKIAVDAPPPTPPAPIIPPRHTEIARQNSALLDRSTVERRREHRRRELIQRELEGAGLFWGLAAGAALVAGLGTFLILIGPVLPGVPDAPLGMPRVAFNVIMFGLLLAAGVLTGRSILRDTRRRIVAELSKMPYERLLKRCEGG